MAILIVEGFDAYEKQSCDAMTEISDAAKKTIEETVEAYPDAWKTGICSYAVVEKADGEFLSKPNINTACHSSLYPIERNPAAVVVNAHKPTGQGKYPEFIKWACRESPFAYAVLNKDNEKEILGKASVIDAELIGRGGCLWLCKALRFPVEDTFRLPVWYQLREQGLDGLQSFIGCNIVNYQGEPAWDTSHNSLFGYNDPTALRKAYDETKNLRRIEGSYVRKDGLYGTVWGSLKNKYEKKPDGWGGFIQVKVPTDAKEFAAQLKEIFEGNPENVK